MIEPWYSSHRRIDGQWEGWYSGTGERSSGQLLGGGERCSIRKKYPPPLIPNTIPAVRRGPLCTLIRGGGQTVERTPAREESNPPAKRGAAQTQLELHNSPFLIDLSDSMSFRPLRSEQQGSAVDPADRGQSSATPPRRQVLPTMRPSHGLMGSWAHGLVFFQVFFEGRGVGRGLSFCQIYLLEYFI